MAVGGDGNCECPGILFVIHVLHRSRCPADHACNWFAVPSTRSATVDRELPSREPTIEFVRSVAETIFNTYYPLLGEPGQEEGPHDFFVSDAKDHADERGKDLCAADFRGKIVQPVLGQAADCDASILSAIALYPHEVGMSR